MRLTVNINEKDIKQMALESLAAAMPLVPIPVEKVHFETKSKQNYRSEWEEAAFRISIDVEIDFSKWRGLRGESL